MVEAEAFIVGRQRRGVVSGFIGMMHLPVRADDTTRPTLACMMASSSVSAAPEPPRFP